MHHRGYRLFDDGWRSLAGVIVTTFLESHLLHLSYIILRFVAVSCHEVWPKLVNGYVLQHGPQFSPTISANVLHSRCRCTQKEKLGWFHVAGICLTAVVSIPPIAQIIRSD